MSRSRDSLRVEGLGQSVRLSIHLVAPFMRALPTACELDRSLIAAQPNRCGQETRGDYQPNPQTRAAQESPRSKLRHGTEGSYLVL